MEQATKKKLLIGGALLVVAGVGGYFLYKFFKDKADKKREEEQKGKDQSQPTTSPTPTTTPSSGGAFGPFKNSTEVKAFQDWMDKNYPNWVNGKNLNKGSGYGTYGPSTTKAWNTYGAEYIKATTTKTPEQIKAERDAAFAKAMADAKKAGAPSFVFEGKAYDTNTGALYVDPKTIVVGNTVYVKTKGGVPTEYQEGSSGVSAYTGAGLYTKFDGGGNAYFGNFSYGTKAGIVQEVNNTWQSVKISNNDNPVKQGDKVYTTFWMPISALTKTANSSSFEGMTVEYIGSTI